MQHVIKNKDSMVATMWLNFGGALSSLCVGFINVAVPIRYGYPENPNKTRSHRTQ